MTGDRASEPARIPVWRRIRETLRAYPDAVAIGLYALALMALVVAAYLAIFSILQPYDDEGTVLATLKGFVGGEVLYRDFWSVYGPFYYELFGGLFSLTGHAITTDASRSIVIVIWVGSSLMLGIAAQRISGYLALGIAGMFVAFAALGVLTNEPMHPQGLCVLLLAAFVLLAVWGPPSRLGWAGAGCGALLAALLLTKVNLGIFAVAAVALAAELTLEPLRRRGWVVGVIVLGFLGLPTAVMWRDLGEAWVRELVVIETLAGVALVLAGWPQRRQDDDSHQQALGWLRAAAAGFAVALVAIVVAVLLTGPSLSDVYHGTVTDALQIRDLVRIPLRFPARAAVEWAVATALLAALAGRLRRAPGGPPPLWSGALRGLVGLAIWFGAVGIAPLALSPSSGNPVLVPLLLAWVAAFPPSAAEEPPYRRFVRLLLPALAVAESLQVYPVAGSQTGIAAFVFVPVGAICLGDALNELRAWSHVRGRLGVERFTPVAGAVTIALAAVIGLNAVLLPGVSNAILYDENEKLPFPGAGSVHLPAEAVATYTELVDLLHRDRCTTLVGWPNINSLNMWSGVEPPGTQIPNGWFDALSASRQQRIVETMRASPRPCVIRDEGLAAIYLRGAPPPSRPLVRYINGDFEVATSVGEYEFLLPKRAAATG